MHFRLAAGLAWSLWVIVLLLWASAVLLYVVSGLPPIPDGLDGGPGELLVLGLRVTGFVGASTVGALIAVRQPTNPLGWLIGAAGAFSVFQVVANRYTAYAELVNEHPLLGEGVWLAWAAGLLSAAAALLPPSFLFMPNGRLPSRRWAPLMALGPFLAAPIMRPFVSREEFRSSMRLWRGRRPYIMAVAAFFAPGVFMAVVVVLSNIIGLGPARWPP
jgi:hypothetical protein